MRGLGVVKRRGKTCMEYNFREVAHMVGAILWLDEHVEMRVWQKWKINAHLIRGDRSWRE